MVSGTEIFSPLVQALFAVSPLSEEEKGALEGIIQHRYFPKNTELLKLGQVARNMFFVDKGLARVYYYRNELEATDYFAMNKQFIGGVESLFTLQPSKRPFSSSRTRTFSSFPPLTSMPAV